MPPCLYHEIDQAPAGFQRENRVSRLTQPGVRGGFSGSGQPIYLAAASLLR
jgi:hypothetical protein